MRSRFGVGITPPNVLETPKPVSSVMIKSTLGAPWGGTTRGGPVWRGLRSVALDLTAEFRRQRRQLVALYRRCCAGRARYTGCRLCEANASSQSKQQRSADQPARNRPAHELQRFF